jgi:hypothetical protein
MPEATMNLDNGVVPWQDNIGSSRKITPMKPESIAHGVQQFAHLQLGACVLLPVPSHDPRSRCGFGQFIVAHGRH